MTSPDRAHPLPTAPPPPLLLPPQLLSLDLTLPEHRASLLTERKEEKTASDSD